MPQMHAIAARTSSSVQEERFPLLKAIQDLIKLPESTRLALTIREQVSHSLHTDERRTSLFSIIHAADVQ